MTFALQSESLRPDLKITGSADFSADDIYRYTLWRRWDSTKPYVNFILLNPSTADANKDDPTMRRCIDYARQWGCGAQCTTNIFSYRATDPREMKAAGDPVGSGNDEWIITTAAGAGLVVLGFGTHGEFLDRGQKVVAILRDHRIALRCLKITKDGWPSHPLYLRRNLKTIPFP